jgi:glycosyltransferase involved in cell wall biosynthesis
MSRARFLVAQTGEARSDLLSFLPEADVRVLANPVELPNDVPPLTNTQTACFTGRFSVEKDLLTLLSVWRELLAEFPRARLRLVGEGGGYRSVASEIDQTIRGDETLTKSVTVTGWVADVRKELSLSDLYVFPSLSEGMSNSLLEACAYGRIVVASDIAPNVAIVGQDYPLLFRAGDSKSMLETIHKALSSSPTRVEARTIVLDRARHFSAVHIVRNFEKLILDAQSRTRN